MDQSSSVAFGTPSIRCQTFGEDVKQAPGASQQNPIGSCSRQLLAESGPSFSGRDFRKDSRLCGVAVSRTF